MSRNFDYDFKQSMNALHFSSGDKEKMIRSLKQSIQAESEREDNLMKKWTLPKAAAVAAACLMVTGVTAFAASKIAWYESSSNGNYDYTSAADMALEKSDVTMPDFPETIGGDYAFDGGNTVHVGGKDDSGNTVGTWDDLNAVYKNKDGNMIDMRMSQKPIDDGGRAATETRTIGGITVSYNYDEYLVLPPEAEEEGLDAEIQERLNTDDHFFVSYGSKEAETYYFSGVSFAKDGVSFNILTSDNITADALFSIAEELINR